LILEPRAFRDSPELARHDRLILAPHRYLTRQQVVRQFELVVDSGNACIYA
jgi:hypothetical protein